MKIHNDWDATKHNIFKKLLSYVWPQTTKINTDYNGVLELTWFNGRKILDSKNANYSYGTLQRLLEEGVSKIDLKKVGCILLLGLGGGSIIASLREKFSYNKKIDAIDIDRIVISIAEKEFGIFASENLYIENLDALEFVKNCKSTYDLIIVDLFIDSQVPSQFLTVEFCNYLSRILNGEGTILYNLGIKVINESTQHLVVDYFRNNNEFECKLLERVQRTNMLLLAVKITQNNK